MADSKHSTTSECFAHEHSHTHDEHCTCPECHHEHSHKNKEVSVDTHEGSIIGTLSYNSDADYEELKEKCLSNIKTLKKWALTNRYLIGHIKGYVEKDSMFCMFSTTGANITVTESTSATAGTDFNIVCIIFGTTTAEMESQLNTLL